VGALFVDTSALVKYYYPEKGAEVVENAILSAQKVYISQLARAEFASAIMKKVRMGTLDIGDRDLIWNAFLDDLHADRMELLDFDESHFGRAAELIIRYGQQRGIRTLDALQLVAAFNVRDAVFLVADRLLFDLAVQMGLKAENVA
jgi:predicted nucleic acid-binding protein